VKRSPARTSVPQKHDILTTPFRSETRATPELILPHSRAHERGFVLQPLSEIAPDLILPGQTKTVAQFLAKLHALEIEFGRLPNKVF
jgi:2-amino-4-hydroxy-6-hydroxymethyldihydropteridine diphosphokinase